MAVPEPLHRTVQTIQFTDNEIKTLARNAAREAKKIMADLEGKVGVGAQVRRAQIAMAKLNAEMWAGVGDATKIGVGDAVWNSTEMQALFDEALFSSAGFSARYWRESMIAQAQGNIENLIARKQNGYTLSEKVYKNSALSKGYIDKTIDNGLLLGKSGREIAADVVKFINPDVAGGASAAALRLGRTEVNNAFHTNSINHAKNTPWIEQMKWHLSGSHSRPDQCNEYADNNGNGLFDVDDVPAKPHPNCLCYVTPVSPSLDKFVSGFKSGQYDEYIDKQMGCYRVA